MGVESDYPVLTKDSIMEAIDRTCNRFNLENPKWQLARHALPNVDQSAHEEFLYGFVAKSFGSDDEISLLTTFYFAYSTWDGRVLYVDERYRGTDDELKLHLRRALSDIAIQLKCNRLTWQHYADDDGEPLYPEDIQPETLHGWLTLHWQADSIRAFLCTQGTPAVPQDNRNTSLEGIISNVLDNLSHETFQLRLATEDDLPHICRLVQGLADFEKEYDAVHVTADHYRVDGFQSKRLFRCLLLDHVNENEELYTCGMAFHYLGSTSEDGLFLYLEDLFIEEKYRKNGAGTFVMKTLASIGISLGCSRLVWQALVSAILPCGFPLAPSSTFPIVRIGTHRLYPFMINWELKSRKGF